MMFNRWLRDAAKRIDQLFARVKFLPAQLSFLDAQGSKMQYFNEDDKLTLNQLGAVHFRNTLFKLTGFVHNDN